MQSVRRDQSQSRVRTTTRSACSQSGGIRVRVESEQLLEVHAVSQVEYLSESLRVVGTCDEGGHGIEGLSEYSVVCMAIRSVLTQILWGSHSI